MGDESRYVHSARQRTRRPQGHGWIVGVAAGVVAVVLVGIIGVRAVLVRALCEQSPVRLHVAAALDIAPAVMRIGQHFNDLNRDVGGHCAMVQVTEEPPYAVASELSGTGTMRGESQIDAWVPDSSLWPDLVRNSPRGATAVRWTGISVAKSPLVIAAPRKVADTVTQQWSRHINWYTLFPASMGGPPPSLGLQIQLPDPAQNAAGLATIVEVRRLIGNRPTAARAGFTAFAHAVQPTTALQGVPGLTAFTASSQPPWFSHPVTVTTEQAVGSYNQSDPRVPLSAFYPPQEYDLDYPFVVTTSAPLKLQAAQQFEQVLRSSLATIYVRADGFRPPNGETGQASQVVEHPQPGVTLAAPGEAAAAVQAWQRLGLGSVQLILDDVSGAMTQPLQPGSDSRIRVIQDAAAVGLALAPDTTQMGVWEYSYQLAGSLPYRVVVSMGPLPEQVGLVTRRQQLQEMTQTVTAQPGTPTATYSTILAGFRWMTAHYQPGHINAVVVLGSGAETAPHDISLSDMLASLRKDYDPRRPVEIIIISAGNDGNQTALQQIAAITHAQAYVVERPADMLQVFYDAVGRRICLPTC